MEFLRKLNFGIKMLGNVKIRVNAKDCNRMQKFCDRTKFNQAMQSFVREQIKYFLGGVNYISMLLHSPKKPTKA